jgi:hypothetical protein
MTTSLNNEQTPLAPIAIEPTVIVGRYSTRAHAEQALTELQDRHPHREYQVREVKPWQIVIS